MIDLKSEQEKREMCKFNPVSFYFCFPPSLKKIIKIDEWVFLRTIIETYASNGVAGAAVFPAKPTDLIWWRAFIRRDLPSSTVAACVCL